LNLKPLIGIGIVLLDLFVIIFITTKIGIKTVALFTLTYMLSLMAWSVILILMGFADEKKWKIAYIKNKSKVNWTKAGVIMIYILSSFFALYMFPEKYLIIGISSAFSVISYLMFFCKDFLYFVNEYTLTFQNLLLKKYPKYLKR